MKKFFVIFLSLLLVLTGCTSQPKPETAVPAENDKFAEAQAPEESSKPVEESSKPTEESSEVTESSTPTTEAGAFDGAYSLDQVFSITDGVESQIYSYAESQEEMIYAEISGTSFKMISYNGDSNLATIDQATGKVTMEDGDEHLDATLEDGMLIMVSNEYDMRYVFRKIEGEEAASMKKDFEARAAAYAEDNSSQPEESSKPEESSQPEESSTTTTTVDNDNIPEIDSYYGTRATDAQLPITGFYTLKTDYSLEYIGVMTSNLDKTYEIYFFVFGFDKDNNLIDKVYGYQYAAAPGDDIAISCSWYNEQEPDHVAYAAYYYDYGDTYIAYADQIEIVVSFLSDQVVMEAINHGDKVAETILANLLFYNDKDEFQDYRYCYFGIDGLAPGEHDVEVIYTWGEEYDSLMLYTGAYAKNRTTNEIVDPSVLVVKADYEYIEYGCIYKAIVVENTSDKNLVIPATLVLRDAGGVAIGCGFETIDVLGPGETTIIHAGTTPVEGGPDVATKEYMLKPYETTYYAPVIGGLSASSAPADGSKISVSVTNSGTLPAKYVEAYVVFFDASGAVIDIESSYVSDSDGEIKPGATETKEIWGPSSGYDHVEIYFTGYGRTE